MKTVIEKVNFTKKYVSIMNEEIFAQEEDFQPYLLENHYTFVGPANENLLEEFIKNANLIDSPNVFHTVYDVLSNRNVTRLALEYLQSDTQLRVYVMIPSNDTFLIHATISDYCKKFNVNYPEN